MGETVGEHRAGAGLQVGFRPVHELMPTAVGRLEGGDGREQLPERFQRLFPPGRIFRNDVQHVAEGQDGPAVGPRPMIVGMDGHPFYPAMTENPFLRHPEVFLEKEDLLHGRGVQFSRQGLVAFRIGQGAAISDGRDAHIHIIQPDGIRRRTHPGEDPVRKPVLFLVHEVEPAVQLAPERLAFDR